MDHVIRRTTVSFPTSFIWTWNGLEELASPLPHTQGVQGVLERWDVGIGAVRRLRACGNMLSMKPMSSPTYRNNVTAEQ